MHIFSKKDLYSNLTRDTKKGYFEINCSIFISSKQASTFFFRLFTFYYFEFILKRGCGDHMVVGFTTTHAISAYHHLSCEFESHWWGVPDTTLRDKVAQ